MASSRAKASLVAAQRLAPAGCGRRRRPRPRRERPRRPARPPRRPWRRAGARRRRRSRPGRLRRRTWPSSSTCPCRSSRSGRARSRPRSQRRERQVARRRGPAAAADAEHGLERRPRLADQHGQAVDRGQARAPGRPDQEGGVAAAGRSCPSPPRRPGRRQIDVGAARCSGVDHQAGVREGAPAPSADRRSRPDRRPGPRRASTGAVQHARPRALRPPAGPPTAARAAPPAPSTTTAGPVERQRAAPVRPGPPSGPTPSVLSACDLAVLGTPGDWPSRTARAGRGRCRPGASACSLNGAVTFSPRTRPARPAATRASKPAGVLRREGDIGARPARRPRSRRCGSPGSANGRSAGRRCRRPRRLR